MSTPKPVVLCILDGWGLRQERSSNAPALAATPAFDRMMASCPSSTLVTHGPDAGLPTGQMGNSEVGHTNIGAGRVVAMDLGRIGLAIEDGSFARAAALREFIEDVAAAAGTVHLMGLVSDGGVHGHVDHLEAAVAILTRASVPVAIHAVTDGRDTAPKSADDDIAGLRANLPEGARIATVTGRYYAMDRDNRWERVSAAYDAMIRARGARADDAAAAVTSAYADGLTDEFIPPSVIGDYEGVRDGDGFFCMNFRADRARQITRAIGDPSFAEFDTGTRPRLSAMLGMTEYSDGHNTYMTAVFPRQRISDTLGAWVARHGLRQYRLAETEKYPHVTFFLNGGKEEPEPG